MEPRRATGAVGVSPTIMISTSARDAYVTSHALTVP